MNLVAALGLDRYHSVDSESPPLGGAGNGNAKYGRKAMRSEIARRRGLGSLEGWSPLFLKVGSTVQRLPVL